ncbi:MAG: hypothetical protein LH481_13925, partial [Burkholderiales bacterium]|nr:hypothetical protein [Burkholderiales bacterium]
VLGVAPITLTATSSSGLTSFTFSTSSAASVCAVAGNQLTIVGAGPCIVTATQAGNANFASAALTAYVIINSVDQATKARALVPIIDFLQD